MSKEEKKEEITEKKKETKESKEKKELTINDLPGVGAATAEKLKESGYDNLISLAVASPGELVQAAGLGESPARKLINFCRNHLDMGFESGDQLLKKREQIEKITTGSKVFDALIGGGFETGSISETFGQFGSGKCVAKDTPVFYFNPNKLHLANIKETYETYKEKFGEKPYEEGFVVPLSDVSVLGLTDKGLRKTKAKFLYKEYAKKIFEVTTKRGRVMRFTGAHKLLTFNEGLQWKPTGMFKSGDVIACPSKLDCGENRTILEDDAYFLGLFVAEGTANPLSITTGSKKLKDWLFRYIENKFGYKPTIRGRKGKTCNHHIVLFRKGTKEFLGKLASSNAATKFVPESILSGDEIVAKKFLAGYLDGDGCIRKDEISATTKSKQLATGLSYVFLKIGILTTLRDQKGFFRVNVVGEDRGYLELPLKIKNINNHTKNSSYGCTGSILEYLSEMYTKTLGGNRGRQEKHIGRKKNHKDIFYHYLTRKSQRSRAMNKKTFVKIVKMFELGRTYIDEALTLLPDISNIKKFRKLYGILPFAFNSLHKELGLTKTALQNYKQRGIPKERLLKLRESLANELLKKKKILNEAIENTKRIAYFDWDVVETLTEKDYNNYVYDFVVPEGHSFVAGEMPTVMHNSQIAHVLAVTTQLPKEKGGANGSVVFIDGESTFRPERIQQIAKGFGLDPQKTLKNIHVGRAFNSDHQMLLAERAEEIIKKHGNIKLMIVDSLTAHFRADFTGRGQLADRQQKLNRHMHVLMKLATKYNICIYVTNQVMAKPDTFFGDPTAAIGGNIVGHNCLIPGTLVQLGDGLIKPIEELHNYKDVISFDLKSTLEANKNNIGTIVVKKGDGKIYDIKTTRNIKSSGKHRFFKIENFDIKEIMARELKKGDYILQASNIGIEGEEQKLPETEILRIAKLSKEGSNLIKKETKETNRKEICKNLSITPRQFRRVLNQAYPTNIHNFYTLAETYTGNQLLQFVEQVETNKHRNYTIPKTLNVNFAQILGYFLGDGNLEERSLKFRDARQDVLETYNKLFGNLFWIKGRIRKLNGKNCFNLDINNKVVRNFVKEIYMDLFDYITKSPKQHVCTFLKGFFDAEGSISKKRPHISASQSDEKVLTYIQLLLDRVGIRSSIRNYLHNGNRIYHLDIIDAISVLKYAEMIGFSARDKKKILDKWKRHCKNGFDQEMTPIKRKNLWNLIKEFKMYPSKVLRSRPESYRYVGMRELKKVIKALLNVKVESSKLRDKLNFLVGLVNSEIRWEKIRKIEVEDYDGFLYDFAVSNTENYIANGFIVHNSSTRIYLRKGKKGSRVAKLIDSPHLPDAEAAFMVTEEGLKDLD